MATINSKSSVPMSYEEIIEALDVKILPPEENDNFLDNIIGLENPKKYLKQILEFYNNPENYKDYNMTMFRKFLLIGQEGVGKAMTTYAFAKEANLPIVVIEADRFVTPNALTLMKNFSVVLDKHRPAVVLLKNIAYISELSDEKSTAVYTKLCDYLVNYEDCFFFTTLATYASFPENLFSEKGFNTTLIFEVPDLAQREELLKRFLTRFSHDESLDSNEKNSDLKKIAKNTLGMTAGNLIHLLENSMVQSFMDGHTQLNYFSIDTTLSSNLFGNARKTMTDEERRLTAYHEAGHVVAGYFSNPKYKLSKVEIVHRTFSLGLTVHEADEDKLSYTKEDFENDIILSYGGMAAERLMINTNTSGVSEDLRQATKTASNMICLFGMDDDFGPISLDDENFMSDTLAEEADILLQKMLKNLYAKTERIMLEHKAELIALSEALIEKETVYSDEILEIFKKAKEN